MYKLPNKSLGNHQEYDSAFTVSQFQRAAFKYKSINKEIVKVKEMSKFSGYIPFGDHLIPPNVSWENYKYFRQNIKEVIFR